MDLWHIIRDRWKFGRSYLCALEIHPQALYLEPHHGRGHIMLSRGHYVVARYFVLALYFM